MGIITKEEVERLHQEVIAAVTGRAVIWGYGEVTIHNRQKGYSSELDKDSFEGEIVRGELLGSRITVHCPGGKEGKSFMGYIFTQHGQLQLNKETGEIM